MTTGAGVPGAPVASVALWVAALIAGAHRLLGAGESSRLGLALNATLHLLAAVAFAIGLGIGAAATASSAVFVGLAVFGAVCGHEALTSRLGERLWHDTGIAEGLRRWGDRCLTGMVILYDLWMDQIPEKRTPRSEPFLPPRESRVRRLAFGVVAVLALFGATVLLG